MTAVHSVNYRALGDCSQDECCCDCSQDDCCWDCSQHECCCKYDVTRTTVVILGGTNVVIVAKKNVQTVTRTNVVNVARLSVVRHVINNAEMPGTQSSEKCSR